MRLFHEIIDYTTYADELLYHRERELSYFPSDLLLSKTKAISRIIALLNIKVYTTPPLKIIDANLVVRFENLIVVRTYSGVFFHKPTITILGSSA
jgi:hypothetical protein